MSENFGRRSDDRGKEDPMVTLARIDENIKFLKFGAEAVRIQLHEHEIDDNKKFKDVTNEFNGIKRSIWIAAGGLSVIVFLVNIIFKH